MIKFARSLALLLALTSAASAKQPLEKIVRQDYPVPPDVALTVHLTDGTVHIYGSDENVIKLTAIKKAYTQERLDGITIDVQVKEKVATIATTLPSKPEGLSLSDRSGTVDYVLLVPQTARLAEIEVGDGEIVIDGMRGAGVDLRLTNGRILALNCFTPTDLRVERGAIDVGYFWWEPQGFGLKAQSTVGDIRLALPPDASARFDLATGDGWIRNQFAGDDQNSDAHAVQWTLGEQPATTIDLRTQSGNVRVERIY